MMGEIWRRIRNTHLSHVQIGVDEPGHESGDEHLDQVVALLLAVLDEAGEDGAADQARAVHLARLALLEQVRHRLDQFRRVGADRLGNVGRLNAPAVDISRLEKTQALYCIVIVQAIVQIRPRLIVNRVRNLMPRQEGFQGIFHHPARRVLLAKFCQRFPACVLIRKWRNKTTRVNRAPSVIWAHLGKRVSAKLPS